jgi:hypothetical protein
MIKAFVLLLTLFMGSAWAKEAVVVIRARQADGSIKKLNVFQYINHWGNKEVRIESATLPRIGRVNPIYGYGRDTDDDGRIDTWFMIDVDEGLRVYRIPTRFNWGVDVIERKLFSTHEYALKSHFSATYGAVFGFLLMSVSHGYESERELWRELIDIEEFTIRMERARAEGQLTREQWDDSIDLITSSYREAIQRFERATGRNYWALVGGDVVLWTTGGIVLRFLSKGLALIGKPAAQSTIGQSAKAIITKMAQGINDRARAQISRFRKMKGAPANALAAEVVKRRFPSRMRALMAKNIIYRKAIPPIVRTGIAMKKAVLDWKYIALMGTLQLSTEAIANSSEVWSPNPTTFAKNVLTHPDITQNVSYMTTNAFLFTAASHGIRPRGIRFATCGFIALGNSGISNIIIRGENDYERIALDTSWEAIIGNTQVQVDLAALKHFEKKALKTGNPRLKLLGWAVVLVDQVAGFTGYSLATRYLSEKQEDIDIQLVPVLAE